MSSIIEGYNYDFFISFRQKENKEIYLSLIERSKNECENDSQVKRLEKSFKLHILAQNGHPFLSKADSNSCGKRTVIPAENGHGFLLKADSRPL